MQYCTDKVGDGDEKQKHREKAYQVFSLEYGIRYGQAKTRRQKARTGSDENAVVENGADVVDDGTKGNKGEWPWGHTKGYLVPGDYQPRKP